MIEFESRSLSLAIILSLLSDGLRGPVQQDDPHILLDQPVVAFEYQLSQLTNEQLVKVEREPDVAKYRPIYDALLRRKGLSREYRDEALAALMKLDLQSQA